MHYAEGLRRRRHCRVSSLTFNRAHKLSPFPVFVRGENGVKVHQSLGLRKRLRSDSVVVQIARNVFSHEIAEDFIGDRGEETRFPRRGCEIERERYPLTVKGIPRQHGRILRRQNRKNLDKIT